MADSRLEVDYGVWSALRKVAVAAIVLAGITGLALLYVPILRQRAALEKEIEFKNAALRKGQDLNQRYNEEILELKTDPEAVERAVRETLKFAKPEETIYYFESRGDKRR